MTDIRVEVYSRNGCCLCKEAKDIINRVSKDMPIIFKEIDITSSEELLRRYREHIPIIFINGKKAFKFKVDETEFRKRLRREIIKNALLKRYRGRLKTA